MNYIKFCNFCGSTSHDSKRCQLEKKVSPIIKKKIGEYFEHFVRKYYYCPCCSEKNLNYKLEVIGLNLPSCDIRCSNKDCDFIAEVKSKCLSAKNIPKDIYLLHGNYKKFMVKKDKGLNLIVIIYKINRRTKCISVREVRFIKNNELFDKNLIINKVDSRKDDNGIIRMNSIISIRNRTKFENWTPNFPINFSFLNLLVKIMRNQDNEDIDIEYIIKFSKSQFNTCIKKHINNNLVYNI
tara:strand:+ start:536 stop:1252 length:717 start_codon:yes stop_codon:yes gene_type:complete